MEEFPIMFEDLNEQTQKSMLEAFGLSSPDEANWGTLPITVLNVENALWERASDIIKYDVDSNSKEGVLQEVKALFDNGDITKRMLEYIIDNLDELLEENFGGKL